MTDTQSLQNEEITITSPVDDLHWHSFVKAPFKVGNKDKIAWHAEVDAIVVGFGGAGACAAIEAAENGLQVAVIERFSGGGATALSGGIYYSGGGTSYQKANGIEDDADNMCRYLSLEVGDAVKPDTLQKFCNDALDNMAWLESHDVQFDSTLCPVKTSYPTQDYYLYYSGNETVAEYAEQAKPAARGHRAVGKGLSGSAFYTPLKASAIRRGVKTYYQSKVTRLIQDESNKVIGVEFSQIPANSQVAKNHALFQKLSTDLRLYLPPLAQFFKNKMLKLEESAVTRRVYCRKGVVISSGGFVLNRSMVEHHAPKYAKAMALGAIGCDGSGIRLGQSVGGSVGRMDQVSAWRFINPPMAWAQGIVVNSEGNRYCNEQVYGAKLGYHMCEENNGRAIIIINKALFIKAVKQVFPGKVWLFQTMPALMNLFLNAKKGNTLSELAEKCQLPSDALQQSVDTYNKAVKGEVAEPFNKSVEFLHSLEEGPYYAMDVSVDSKLFPCPSITLGGLQVDESTGQVLDERGDGIEGLYAAGRSAVGVASNLYVSGLSIADCVFSGRRAGKSLSE